MTDEEKEAMRVFKSEYETSDHYSSDLIIELDDAEILLNLIEKQQKEIEELRSEIDEHVYNGCDYELCNKKWEDKIKAKIEEYNDKGLTVNLVNRSAGKTFEQAVRYEVRKVLQSLLEEKE